MKQIQKYNETKWIKLRETALKRDKYIDQIEKRYGKVKEAEVVHHIFPVEQYPEYQYCLWNLISITRATHNKMHIRDSQELTRLGYDLMERVARKQGIKIPPYVEKEKKRSRRDSFYY